VGRRKEISQQHKALDVSGNNLMTFNTKRYTFLRLTLEPLDKIDILTLALFIIFIVINFYSVDNFPGLQFVNAFTCGLLFWTFITTGTFGIRFKKAYFSIAWLTFSILILFRNYSISYLPLLCFLHFHFFRVMFWNKHGRELIPFERLKKPLLQVS
jgi:hypothetical protein